MSGRNGNRKRPTHYEVGYGKPPSEHRFAKGQSGNPKGRPKGKKNIDTMLRETLLATIPIQINGKTTNVTALEAIVLKLRNNAIAGDFRSAVQAIQLGMRALQPEETESSAVASPLDQNAMMDLMRDYLEHQDPAANDDGSKTDEEE
ncbi:DUF5681 domain-containing protein [Mesorhizobium sp. WSM4887]|uniref:DUF5681 domain-containing protein n=1 Tax=Mesorhizobium sp. WSM4887 TaxID=3038543 RepID=UPI002417A79D|nr:DUF5681 domain-containing protein [Mesorhizobium sp. WSM4887]MDG4886809.1 DUF5681 domain-containing protein [Mesorhizobium sp. WSM4887]